MIVLRDPQQTSQVVQPEIQAFLRERFYDLCHPEPYDPDEHGFFILVEHGDTSEQIESATGYSLLKSLFYNTVYGDPDFTPDFEYMEDHGSFFEAVYIFNDSGFAVIIIVPNEEGIDGKILELCAEYAIPSPVEFRPFLQPLSPDVAAFLKGLDENMLEFYQERAAIAEFEAGMTRREAEQFALELTRDHFKLTHI